MKRIPIIDFRQYVWPLIVALAVVLFLFCVKAHAEDQYATKSKTIAEALLKASLNDPDSLKIDSATVYRRAEFGNVCGTLRAKNAYGGYIRANFVVSDSPYMPLYVGPIPLAAFKKDCSGEIVE